MQRYAHVHHHSQCPLTSEQLWCWINNDWNQLRIYTYYIPIWICILLSFIIYVAVGYHVFHQRNQLRNMTFSQNASGQDGKSAVRSENNDLEVTEKVHGSVPFCPRLSS